MLGQLSNVSIGKQTSAADPTTLPRQSLNIYSITGGQTEADSDDNILGGNLQNGSDPVAPAPALDDHKVTIKAPLCIAQAPFWFAAFFGDETATGTATDYTHSWKSGQALPYVFLEHQLKANLFRRHWALVGESFTIDLDAEREGFGMLEMTFVGLKETKATAVLTGTITAAPTLDRPAQKLVNAIYNSVSGGDLMGGKFTFARQLKRYRGADGTGIPYSVELTGNSTLTGSLRTRFQDDTFFDDGVSKVERALALQLMRTSTRGLKFALPHLRLGRTPIGVDGPGEIELQMDFRSWQTTTDAALSVQALNSSATVTL